MEKPMCLQKSPCVLTGEKKNMLGVDAKQLGMYLIAMVHTANYKFLSYPIQFCQATR